MKTNMNLAKNTGLVPIKITYDHLCFNLYYIIQVSSQKFMVGSSKIVVRRMGKSPIITLGITLVKCRILTYTISGVIVNLPYKLQH